MGNDQAPKFFRDRHEDITFLPKYFRDNGFYAWTIGKVFHGNIPKGTYDKVEWASGEFSTFNCTNDTPELKHDHFCPRPDDEDHKLPDTNVKDKVVEFLREQGRLRKENAEETKPFFATVGFYRPHLAYTVPQRYLKLYNKLDRAPNRFFPIKTKRIAYYPWKGEYSGQEFAHLKLNGSVGDKMTEALDKVNRGMYYACLSYIDDLTSFLTELVIGIENLVS